MSDGAYMERLGVVRDRIAQLDGRVLTEDDLVIVGDNWPGDSECRPFVAWDVGPRATFYIDYNDRGRMVVLPDGPGGRPVLTPEDVRRLARLDCAMDGAMLSSFVELDELEIAALVIVASRSVA